MCKARVDTCRIAWCATDATIDGFDAGQVICDASALCGARCLGRLDTQFVPCGFAAEGVRATYAGFARGFHTAGCRRRDTAFAWCNGTNAGFCGG